MQTLYQAFAQAVTDAPNAPFLAQPPSMGGRVWRYAEVADEQLEDFVGQLGLRAAQAVKTAS